MSSDEPSFSVLEKNCMGVYTARCADLNVRMHLHAHDFDGKIDPQYSIYKVQFGFWSKKNDTIGHLEYRVSGFKNIFDRVEPIVQGMNVALMDVPNPRYYTDVNEIRKCIDSLKEQTEHLSKITGPPLGECERMPDVRVNA